MNIHPDNRTAYEAQANLVVANHEMARADFMARPSVILKVQPMKIGESWWAEYGDVTGSGATPDKAMAAFDRIWYGEFQGPNAK